MTYNDYLHSYEWKSLSAKARSRADNMCEMCGGSPDHVHHIKYPKNLSDDVIDNLIVLCFSCHNKVHGKRGLAMNSILELNFEGSTLRAASRDFNGETEWVFRFRDVFDVVEYGENEKTYNNIKNDFPRDRLFSSAWSRIPEKDRREIREKNCPDGPDKVIPYVTEEGVYFLAMIAYSEKADRFRIWLARTTKYIRLHRSCPPHVTNNDMDLSTPAKQFLFVAQQLVKIEDEHRIMDSRVTVTESRVGLIEHKLDERNKEIERISDEGPFTARQRCLMYGIDPEQPIQLPNGTSKAFKYLVGIDASRLSREKGIEPKKMLEGTYKVNLYEKQFIDAAIKIWCPSFQNLITENELLMR